MVTAWLYIAGDVTEVSVEEGPKAEESDRQRSWDQ